VRRSFDTVVFDLDGTLVDTAPDLHAHLDATLAGLGRPGLPRAAVRRMIGDGARTMLARALEATGGIPPEVDLDRLFVGFLERYAADPARFGRVYDGVIPVLDQLASTAMPLGLCTNKAQLPTDRLLAAYGLAGYFGAVIGGDALPVRKPAAGHLDAVLGRLGARPDRSVMVGDSANDLLVARASGVRCVLVSFGYGTTPARELGADRVIDHFAELPAVLAQLAAA
jgi:phosphoglycolate phosphatase